MSRPNPTAPRPFEFPTIERTHLDNGLSVVAVTMPGRTLCTADLVIDAGASHDDVEGTAVLLARAFNEGTTTRDAAAFADACESLGMQLGAGGGWDTMSLSMSAPLSRLGNALNLMAEATWFPSIPEDAFQRVKAERLAQIDQDHANPAMLAAIAFPPTIYAPGSTYARSLRGTKASIGAMTRDTLVAHHERLVDPGSATLVVAGDVNLNAVRTFAEHAFGSFTRPSADRKAPACETLDGALRITIVDRPGSVQSNIVVGHTGIDRHHPDRDAIAIMVYALGGSFSSRINQRLREELGYTYGARGDFDARRAVGPFAVSAPVQGPSTADAVRETLDIIRLMHDGGPTHDEVTAAQEYLAGVHPLRFETPDQVAGSVADLAVHDLPDHDLTEFHDRIRALTLDDVARVARTHLRPEALSVVVVGDASVVRAGLEELGPVTVVTD